MISIIIPIFNRQHLIEETLNSIIAQTYTNWECIIVDDGSTDNTVAITKKIIEADKRFQLVKRPPHLKKGPSSCRNYAITKIIGDYIQFFDSDDIMHPEHLKLKIEAIQDNELYARALSQNKTYAIINTPLIFYRVGSSSSTNNFYSNVSYGLASYFEAKKTVLHLSSAKPIKLAILKMTLGFFRLALAERDFTSAQQCLNFIKNHKLAYSFKLKVKLYRIIFFYTVFKVVKKGDTKFKPLFKL